MNPDNNMDELLVKYLLGEATGAEAQQAMDWVNETKENQTYFESIKNIWDNSKQLQGTSNTGEDAAWERFKARAQKPARKTRPFRPFINLRRIAAILIVVLGCTWLASMFFNKDKSTDLLGNSPKAVERVLNVDTVQAGKTAIQPKVAMHNIESGSTRSIVTHDTGNSTANRTIKMHEKALQQPTDVDMADNAASNGLTKPILNSTPCPIEICISQTMQCPDKKPAEISSCSILESEQSGQLSFKSHDKVSKNCSLTVEEITITSVRTGESIILDQKSTTTAQDLFRYISGEKKGEVLAGVFHADCDHQVSERGLHFDNRSGNWIFQ